MKRLPIISEAAGNNGGEGKKVIAKTPPMGWNSWVSFGEDVNEQLIREVADAFVEHGLADAGYEYIVIDDAAGVCRSGIRTRGWSGPGQIPPAGSKP